MKKTNYQAKYKSDPIITGEITVNTSLKAKKDIVTTLRDRGNNTKQSLQWKVDPKIKKSYYVAQEKSNKSSYLAQYEQSNKSSITSSLSTSRLFFASNLNYKSGTNK